MAEEYPPQDQQELTLWSEEVSSDVRTIERILTANIFGAFQHPCYDFNESAFIHLMICLNDLLQKAKKCGHRINFADDVAQTNQTKDITDLVALIRGAACHIESKTRYAHKGNRFVFITIGGPTANITFGSEGDPAMIKLENPYADDLAFFYGGVRIFLVRHIVTAFQEAKAALIPLTNYPLGFDT